RVNAISQDAMSLYIEKSEKLKQCLKTNEAARYLSLHPSTLSNYVKKGYFPKAFKEKGNYFIPLSDLDEYKKFGTLPKLPKENRTKINTDKQLNKVFLLENLINIIKNFPIPNYIEKTREYYLDYISVRISSLNGHISHIKSECSRAKKCFEKNIVKLQKNCFELSDEKIPSILLDESYPLSHRTLANWFFQYVFSNMGIEKNKNFIIASSPSTKDDGKEIYSPEIYLEYLSYTKNIERHISEAIRSQHYVNMWLYTIMHLMDTWRATD